MKNQDSDACFIPNRLCSAVFQNSVSMFHSTTLIRYFAVIFKDHVSTAEKGGRRIVKATNH